MVPLTQKQSKRPLFIRWEFPAVKTPAGEIPEWTLLRKSTSYIQFAEYLLKNPPNKIPFKPSRMPGGPSIVGEYRKDVENWVSRQMIKSLQLHKGADEEDLFANIVQDLHQLPWSVGSSVRGFFLILPNPQELRAVKRKNPWGLQGMGQPESTYYQAKGLGNWAEPNFRNLESWEARYTIIGVVRTLERLSEAALTGRKVAELGPEKIKLLLKRTERDLLSTLPETEN